jgi:hypothetical protein
VTAAAAAIAAAAAVFATAAATSTVAATANRCHYRVLPLPLPLPTAATFAAKLCTCAAQILKTPKKGRSASQLITSADKYLLIKSEMLEIFQKIKIFQ